MGLYDVVVFEMEMPGFQGRRFQTKNLDCCMDRFAITRTGRLCLTGNEFMDDVEKPEAERVDIDYHGDIRLLAEDGRVSEDGHDEYTARFTHGVLEWIRPADISSAVDLAFKKSRCRAPSD
jgi:hypothetical protein